ncbi:MAG TPA: hypothetical protein EYN91_22355 [Candidatus Melainabacteria bacterium]|nr:hypothetical protein [Candidatus Melainabacteria bacterium]HIN63500.1 hypothetical protein [Candidatus Obscuribacterales bacterium]
MSRPKQASFYPDPDVQNYLESLPAGSRNRAINEAIRELIGKTKRDEFEPFARWMEDNRVQFWGEALIGDRKRQVSLLEVLRCYRDDIDISDSPWKEFGKISSIRTAVLIFKGGEFPCDFMLHDDFERKFPIYQIVVDPQFEYAVNQWLSSTENGSIKIVQGKKTNELKVKVLEAHRVTGLGIFFINVEVRSEIPRENKLDRCPVCYSHVKSESRTSAGGRKISYACGSRIGANKENSEGNFIVPCPNAARFNNLNPEAPFWNNA